MPVTAFGSILFYFLKIFGWFRYTLFRGDREIILFSNLTDKTKAYAKRIDSKDRLLIFCNEEDKKTISLYTVSGHPEAAAIMDNLMKRGTEAPLLYKQTTIDEHKRIAFKLLYDEKLCELVDDNTEKLDILIV